MNTDFLLRSIFWPPASQSTLSSHSLIILSVLGAIALNLIIALNHKPGRYMGVS